MESFKVVVPCEKESILCKDVLYAGLYCKQGCTVCRDVLYAGMYCMQGCNMQGCTVLYAGKQYIGMYCIMYICRSVLYAGLYGM